MKNSLIAKIVCLSALILIMATALFVGMSDNNQKDEQDNLRVQFNAWSCEINKEISDFNSLMKDWQKELMSDSTFLLFSDAYYNDSWTGRFQELERDLWEIDDVAYGTEWDSYSQKLVETVALWNNGVHYFREGVRTNDFSYFWLAEDCFEEAESKINEAVLLVPN